MKVSIISTWWDNPHKDWMNSIKNQTYKDTEIIAGTEEDFGFKERMGAGRMRNELSRKATGDILFFVDADAVLKEDCIERIIEIFNENDCAAVSGLPITPPRMESTFLNYILGIDYEARIRAMGERFVSVAASTCFAVKTKVFGELNGFTEMFKGGIGEDWEFSTRLTNKGYKIFHTNKAQIFHYTAETFFKYLKKQFRHAWYRVYHTKKFGKSGDEYPLLMTGFNRYNPMELLCFFFLFMTRLCVWLLGGVWGVWTFYIRGGYE